MLFKLQILLSILFYYSFKYIEMPKGFWVKNHKPWTLQLTFFTFLKLSTHLSILSTHLLTHSYIHTHTHPPTHSSFHSLHLSTHLSIYSSIHSFITHTHTQSIYPPIHPSICHPSMYSSTYPSTHPLISQSTHAPIHPPRHSPLHLPTHWFTHPPSCPTLFHVSQLQIQMSIIFRNFSLCFIRGQYLLLVYFASFFFWDKFCVQWNV